jgi:hypothetical protein
MGVLGCVWKAEYWEDACICQPLVTGYSATATATLVHAETSLLGTEAAGLVASHRPAYQSYRHVSTTQGRAAWKPPTTPQRHGRKGGPDHDELRRILLADDAQAFARLSKRLQKDLATGHHQIVRVCIVFCVCGCGCVCVSVEGEVNDHFCETLQVLKVSPPPFNTPRSLTSPTTMLQALTAYPTTAPSTGRTTTPPPSPATRPGWGQ